MTLSVFGISSPSLLRSVRATRIACSTLFVSLSRVASLRIRKRGVSTIPARCADRFSRIGTRERLPAPHCFPPDRVDWGGMGSKRERIVTRTRIRKSERPHAAPQNVVGKRSATIIRKSRSRHGAEVAVPHGSYMFGMRRNRLRKDPRSSPFDAIKRGVQSISSPSSSCLRSAMFWMKYNGRKPHSGDEKKR
jgi:hypothetical protein